MRKVTLEQLEATAQMISEQYDEVSEVCLYAVSLEIRRRKRSGRRAVSKLSRREQNRLAQARFRARKKKPLLA